MMSVPFAGHVALLEALLHRNVAIADLIDSRLLVVKAITSPGANREPIQRLLDACFTTCPALRRIPRG